MDDGEKCSKQALIIHIVKASIKKKKKYKQPNSFVIKSKSRLNCIAELKAILL